MDIKEVTVTFKLPKDFQSLHELEMAIHTEGQRIKQQLLENELQAIVSDQKQKASLDPIACPHCLKKTAFSGEANLDS
ncbi:MAG: hypothetical protein ACE1ZS_05885 [Candidatus Poribacteria bacterium]